MPASRLHPSWIDAFVSYASHCEAPDHIYRWVAVATIAGALNRKVWVDQYFFRWYPNFYIILVAPPEVISKSSSADIGINLLRKVEGIHFGSNVVTWPALIQDLADASEPLEIQGWTEQVACVTIASSELGNFLNPDDRPLLDLLITLWDGKPIAKRTVKDGKTLVENPLLNLIGCTTPSWLSDNIPEHMKGGGFLSRIVFVWATRKGRLVANPGAHIPPDIKEREAALLHDLTAIAALKGEMAMTREAFDWSEEWYQALHARRGDNGAPDHATRRQTMLYKLAMILSASRGDSLELSLADFKEADRMLIELEPKAKKVYTVIGQRPEARVQDRVLDMLRSGPLSPGDIYAAIRPYCPKDSEMLDVVMGLQKAGQVVMVPGSGGMMFQLQKER